jgi:N-methylhydantoinase A/oxoprolinase/acetone carboxylase beta subunit
MERSIIIENGGTRTDISVWDGTEFTVTKTLTTPFDLSSELLHSTKHIRCSTTQGTNALVNRKGTRIGLITGDIAVVGELRGSAAERRIRRALFTTDRVRSRRIWSSVLNSFLHPTVERFLYNAEDRLRSHQVKSPLLICRNDGASSRLAKSVASRREKGPTMLSSLLGMLAMVPVVFGVAGYAMVSR